jgi:chromosome segregation ATPase
METNEVVEKPEASAEPSSPVEQAVTPDKSSVQAVKDGSTDLTKKADTKPQPEIDYRKSYEELRPQFTKATQKLSALEKEYGMTKKELATLRQAQEQFARQLAAATEKPIDPAEFIRDLQTQGPKALDGYLQKHISELKKDYEQAYSKISAQNTALEARVEVLRRENDPKNYPNFAELKDAMEEIVNEGKVPDEVFARPIGEVYDYLYNLAKAQHGEEALKQAEQFGQKKAEAAIAKESATTVAAGGNGDVNVANPSKMSASELRQYFIAKGMVSDD